MTEYKDKILYKLLNSIQKPENVEITIPEYAIREFHDALTQVEERVAKDVIDIMLDKDTLGDAIDKVKSKYLKKQ